MAPSRWPEIAPFESDRPLATKMRARYQRRESRDLLALALDYTSRRSNARRIVEMFGQHMDREAGPLTRAMFERNLAGKVHDALFHTDISMQRAEVLGGSRSSAFDAAVTD